MFLRFADLVVEAVAMLVAELVCVGQVAVYSTAESCAFLQSPNVFKQVFFLAFTEFASSTWLFQTFTLILVENSSVGLNLLHSECRSPTGTGADIITGCYFGLKCCQGVRACPFQGGVDEDDLTAVGKSGAAAVQGWSLWGQHWRQI